MNYRDAKDTAVLRNADKEGKTYFKDLTKDKWFSDCQREDMTLEEWKEWYFQNKFTDEEMEKKLKNE